jgi:eukaryotic-like serine/threonine-protein kinase
MAAVHLGRLRGSIGFARTVAIKRLHPHLAKDADFRSMFIDEARLAARITHPNVVQTLDVVADGDEVFLVMEYVVGETLSRLVLGAEAKHERIPPPISVAIVCGALHGLHAAHEACRENGEPLSLVHRDVSPQNLMVGVDGVARVLDFGIAKATGRIHATREGLVKGKLAYMPPEQLAGTVTRMSDVYAAAVVLWEALAQRRLFQADDERELYSKVLDAPIRRPSEVAPDLGTAFDDVVMRGLDRDPERRFPTAREMAAALEACVAPATASQIGAWVRQTAEHALVERAALVRRVEEGAVESSVVARTPRSPSTPRQEGSSTLPVTAPAPRRHRQAGALTALIALGTFALGASTVALVLTRSSPPASPAASALSSASPATSDRAPDVAAPSPIATATPAPSGSGVRAAGTTSSPAPTAVRRRPAQSRPPAQPPPPSVVTAHPAHAGPGCDPPYRVGAQGEKVWLPECFPE